MFSVLSVNDLNAPLEQLLRDHRVRNLSVEELRNLENPQLLPVGSTFEDRWFHCSDRFSDDNAGKIALLWNTIHRSLILDNIFSMEGNSLRYELANDLPQDRPMSGNHAAIVPQKFKRRAVRLPSPPGTYSRRGSFSSRSPSIAADRQLIATPHDLNEAHKFSLHEFKVTLPSSMPTKMIWKTNSLPQGDAVFRYYRPPSMRPPPSHVYHVYPQSGEKKITDKYSDSLTNVNTKRPVDNGTRNKVLSNDNNRSNDENKNLKEDSEQVAETIAKASSLVDIPNTVDITKRDSITGSTKPRNRSFRDTPGPSKQQCHGHVYDNFGFIKPHIRQFYCSIADIRISRESAPPVTMCKNIEEVFSFMSQTYLAKSKMDNFGPNQLEERIDMISTQIIVNEIYHVSLKDTVLDWNSSEEFQRYVLEVLKKQNDGLPYKFIINSLINESERYTLYMDCKNRKKRSSSERSTSRVRATRSTHPLNCSGALQFSYYRKERILAIRHNHKHHHDHALPKDSKLERSVKSPGSLKNVLSDNLLERKDSNISLKDELFEVNDSKINVTVDTDGNVYLNDWTSLIQFCEDNDDSYASFTFFSGKYMAIAVIKKKILHSLRSLNHVESLAIDCTNYINKHPKSEMYIANVTIDRVGICIGYMFLSEEHKVIDSMTDLGARQQCEIAKEVNRVTEAIFDNNPKCVLLSSFLMLLHGTEEDFSLHQMCESLYSMNPKLSIKGSMICNLKATDYDSSITPGRKCKAKRFNSINPELFTCINDIGQINAIRFVFPGIDVATCTERNSKSIRAVATKMSSSKTLPTFLLVDFPDYVKKYSAALFGEKKTHGKDKCPYQGVGFYPNFNCAVCQSHCYSGWLEKPLTASKVKNSDSDKEDDDILDDSVNSLIKMWFEHAKCHPSIPQRFPNIKMLGSSFKEARYYSPDELYQLALSEMIEFCLSKGRLCLMEYLYNNWYNPLTFHTWSQCFFKGCNPFMRSTTSHTFRVLLKNTFGKVRSTVPLNELFSKERDILSPEETLKLDMLLQSSKKHNYENFYKLYETSWIKKRWHMFTQLISELEQPISSDLESIQYAKDCRTYGTNAKNFQCGCYAYKKSNAHICKHILKCIDTESFSSYRSLAIKINLRSRGTAPFYVANCFNDAEKDITEYVWKGLRFKKEYNDFYEKEGASIILEKGGIRLVVIT